MLNRVTIMCCYNNKTLYDSFVESLKTQSEPYDLIAIDNRTKQYKSCSSAYNANIELVKTKFIIFSHQDILFTAEVQLKRFVDYMESMGIYDIMGVAGGKRGVDHVITNISHGQKLKPAGNETLIGTTLVDVVDECFYGGHKECFSYYPYDELLCPGWHLYAVERCLNALYRKNSVYVCDITLAHISKGKINHDYNVDFYNLSKRYAKTFEYIRTTCAYAKTTFPYREWAYLKREISVLLKRY